MAAHTVENIRNIALVGHSGSGKTTLAESILAKLGAIGRAGQVEEGNTVFDHEPEEKEHKHSLSLSIASFDNDGLHFNLIDTPGYPDFFGQALSAFPAVEILAMVIGADKGIQTTHRRLMQVASERNLPRMIIINKIDDHVGDCETLLATIRESFGNECLPLNLPSSGGTDVVDVWDEAAGDADFSSVAEAHQQIIDQAVEVDEELMETYLETGEVDKDKLHHAFERALREGHLVPVVFTSARSGAGLDDLLHILRKHCPNPSEGNPRPFQMIDDSGDREDWFPEADPSKETVGHIFKVTTDQFVGKLAYVRLHQGTLTPGSSIHLDDGKKAIRVSHLYEIFGKETKELEKAVAGDIIALAKIDDLHTGGVLHSSTDKAGLVFKSLPMPKPMFGLAVEAKSRNDESKIGQALQKLVDEDPTFQVDRVAATHETVARGLGELHMRVLLEKLKNRFNVEVDTRPPKVAYKETITAQAEGHHRHKKQTGGAGQFGEVYLKVEPLPDGEANGDGFEFLDETVGGSIPRQFMPAIEKGIRQALVEGAVAGYPMSGVRVRVYDGKYHPVDSKEVAFVTAGKRAFIDAVNKARPALMEPFVDVEITVPSSNMGDITADISGKRGQVQNTDYLPGDLCVVQAKVPLAEMSQYSNQLKSMSGGQGSYVMDYSHDEQTPPNVQAEIVAAFKPAGDED